MVSRMALPEKISLTASLLAFQNFLKTVLFHHACGLNLSRQRSYFILVFDSAAFCLFAFVFLSHTFFIFTCVWRSRVKWKVDQFHTTYHQSLSDCISAITKTLHFWCAAVLENAKAKIPVDLAS